MKRLFKTIGICVGLPIVNIIIAITVQSISIIFLKDINLLNKYIYIVTFIADLITLFLVYIISLPSGKSMLENITFKKVKVKEIIYILLFSIGLSILVLFLTGILTQLIPSYEKVATQITSSNTTLVQLVATVILIPIYEELFFRGVIFGYLRKNHNIVSAILV